MNIDSQYEKVYISSSIYLLNHELYAEKSGKDIKLKFNNWHHYMEDYDYQKLHRGWIKRLKSELSPHNSPWGVKECGGEGDCLFACIEEAFKNFYEPDNEDYSIENLRIKAAEQITKENFEMILETYKSENEIGEFSGGWEPDDIDSIEDLQNELKQCGNNFWGDHIIIQLLQKELDINFIILNDENEFAQKKYTIQRTCCNLDVNKKTIILSYYNNIHYQLVGHFNGKIMKTLFNYDEIPPEMLRIYQEDCY